MQFTRYTTTMLVALALKSFIGYFVITLLRFHTLVVNCAIQFLIFFIYDNNNNIWIITWINMDFLSIIIVFYFKMCDL